MVEMKNAYSILVGKPEGKRPLEISKRRWVIILECISGKLGEKFWIGCIWLRIGISDGLL
jgi:hypothetical protein